jgi:hypothetical protein
MSMRPPSRRNPRAALVGLGLCAGLALAACATPPGPAAPPDSADSAEPALSNTIRWSTASESDNFGFDVYRAVDPEGPFERITADPLLGGGTTNVVRQYRFVDESVQAGQVYFYYVESISLSGERKRFTPVMRAGPKYPPED